MDEPISFHEIDPDNHRNHREYEDAPTCIRCGKAVRRGGFIIIMGYRDELIFPKDAMGIWFEYVLGEECARRVPCSHRRPLDTKTRERIMARERAYRAMRTET